MSITAEKKMERFPFDFQVSQLLKCDKYYTAADFKYLSICVRNLIFLKKLTLNTLSKKIIVALILDRPVRLYACTYMVLHYTRII